MEEQADMEEEAKADMEEEAEEEAVEAMSFIETSLFVHSFSSSTSLMKKRKIDHRTLPREEKRQFRPHEARHCIGRDYLGIPGDPTTPLSNGKDFYDVFRISRSRFQRIMEDFCNTGDPFYLNTKDCTGKELASIAFEMYCIWSPRHSIQ